MGTFDNIFSSNSTQNTPVKSTGTFSSIFNDELDNIKKKKSSLQPGDTITIDGKPMTIGTITQAPPKKVLWEDVPVIGKISKAVTQYATDEKNAVDDWTNKMNQFIFGDYQQDPNSVVMKEVDRTKAQRAADLGNVGLSTTNLVLSPVSSLFNAGEQLPAVGPAFKAVNWLFGKIGQVGSAVTDKGVDLLPIPTDTKETLRPVIDQAGGLVAQILAAKGGDVAKGYVDDAVTSKFQDSIANKTKVGTDLNPAENAFLKYQDLKMKATNIIKSGFDKFYDRQTPTDPTAVPQDKFDLTKDDPEPTPQQKEMIVNEFSNQAQIPKETAAERYNAYLNAMGYEPYVPNESLPTIEMGAKPKETLPTIQADAPADVPRPPKGTRYVPIEEPKAPVSQETPAQVTQPVVSRETTPQPKIEPVKANEVKGTGETKTRSLAAGVEAKAIEDNLTKGFGDLPEYQTVNMKDQAAKAADLIQNDFERAKRIAMGQEKPPEGVIPESVFVGVENKARELRDVNLLNDLATKSSLVTEATSMGQRIRTLAERDPESPVGAIKDIAKTREDAVSEKLKKKGSSIAKETKKITDSIDKEITKRVPKAKDWNSFIKALEC